MNTQILALCGGERRRESEHKQHFVTKRWSENFESWQKETEFLRKQLELGIDFGDFKEAEKHKVAENFSRKKTKNFEIIKFYYLEDSKNTQEID